MNETPASSLNVEPAPEPQAARIALPVLVPTATYVIIGVTVIFYILQKLSVVVFGYAVGQIDWLEVYGARFNAAIRAGELWRFITPVFLHGSVAHIFFNMYALLSIGSFLEKHFGHGRFLLLYFLAAFSGNVFSFLLTGENGYSVGASTAVFGLVAAEVIFFYQNRKLFGSQAKQAISNAVFIIAVNLFIGLSPGIDNWGHVGGLLGGAMFAWFASPRWEVAGIFPNFHLQDEREFRETALGAGLVILIFGALAAFGLFGL
ncbi:MAG: rhomboid family intramembrane serine protease [Anaerolineales bacterium]|nr:rhomboid family intramembrane serine protease [Anaerolineales bacterium]